MTLLLAVAASLLILGSYWVIRIILELDRGSAPAPAVPASQATDSRRHAA